jgi:hypothetical protein
VQREGHAGGELLSVGERPLKYAAQPVPNLLDEPLLRRLTRDSLLHEGEHRPGASRFPVLLVVAESPDWRS